MPLDVDYLIIDTTHNVPSMNEMIGNYSVAKSLTSDDITYFSPWKLK